MSAGRGLSDNEGPGIEAGASVLDLTSIEESKQ